MDPKEVTEFDPHFHDRADAHIHLSNAQITDAKPGTVSASMMYSTARFNAYISWIGWTDPNEMRESRDQLVVRGLGMRDEK